MAGSVFTFTQKTPAIEPGQESNFGSLVVEGSHNVMQVGGGPQTVDISAVPVVSPASVLSTSVTVLTVPLNAIQVNFFALTNTVNISESSATVATNYFTIPAGIMVTVDVARTAKLYLQANTGTSVLSFWFNVV